MSESFPLDVSALNSVLNYLNLGVYITDRDRRIILWNRKAEEITGYKADQVVGRACRDNVLVHIDKEGHALCSCSLCPLHRAMNLNRESAEPMLLYARKVDGSRVAVSVSVAPLRDAQGNVIGGIETFRDETALVRDMEFARKVQQRLFPDPLPTPRGIAFDVRYYAHDLVGGDFYDVLKIDNDRYGVLVADVRGHGVSAALYTMWLKSLEDSQKAAANDAGGFLTRLNRELSRFVVNDSFATAFYAVVNAATGRVQYSNAGHPSPLLWRAAAKATDKLDVHGMPLGISATEEYLATTLQLDPGDLLLCYTDGATEVSGADGQLLDAAGLAKIFERQVKLGPANLLERIYRLVLSHSNAVALKDDVLLLSVKRTE